MKKEERKHRLSLTLLVSAIVFAINLVTVALSGISVYIMIKTGAISSGNEYPSPVKSLMFMGGISLFIGACLVAIISRFSLKPVNRIVNQMNRLAAGDFKARLTLGKPINSHPTFVEVTESFNKMAEELENTELLRNDFINNFSHEFKTPIVSISGFAKLLKKGNLSEEQKRKYIDIIEEESLRLSAMATNVLNIAKVENQTILSDVTQFNLSEQLRSSILVLEGKWRGKNIDFCLDFGEHMISANEEMLKHVWINLIDNAIKFSPSGSTIDLTVNETKEHISVSVLNRGSEIPEDQKKRIFNKFYQADESHSSEGNGIGLALVKGVAELHNGSVSVSSANNVTEFTVMLPKNT